MSSALQLCAPDREKELNGGRKARKQAKIEILDKLAQQGRGRLHSFTFRFIPWEHVSDPTSDESWRKRIRD